MKTIITTVCFFCLISISVICHCANWENPYLDQSSSKAVIKGGSVNDGESISMFSRDSIGIDVYLHEHLSKYTLRTEKNRYWKDTTIEASNFSQNRTFFNISFYDTGMQTITLTSYHLNGDSVVENIKLHSDFPLKQNALYINANDSVTLSTSPVPDDYVMYVWDFHNGTTIKDYKPTVKYLFESVPASTIGELYVVDKNEYRSPSYFFRIGTKELPPMKIISVNDSIHNDTVFASTPTFKFIGKLTGATSVNSILINSKPCGSIVTNADGSFFFYNSFLNVDSLSPITMIIQATDNLNRTIQDTMILKYTVNSIENKPSITIKNPSKDSTTSNIQEIPVFGLLSDAENYSSGAVFVYVNNNLQDGYAAINNWTFLSTVKLDAGWNSIRCDFYPDTIVQGNRLASSEIHVNYDPGSSDTVPPKILYIFNGDSPLLENSVLSTSPLNIKVGILDLSPLQGVTINNVAAHTTDSISYEATINLNHPDNDLIIEVSDIFNNTAYDTIHNVKYNRKPYISGDFSKEQYIADSTIRWKIHASDPDNDTLVITALIKDTIIPMGKDSTISWRPTIKDTGWQTISIQAYDKCDGKADTSFTIYISKSQDEPIAVQWLTNTNDIPDTLFVGEDTLRCNLKENPLSNLPPFNYKVEITDLNKTIHNNTDGALLWVPSINDTGYHTFKFTITDKNNNTDEFTCHVNILPVTAGIRFEKATGSGSESIGTTYLNVILSRKMKNQVTVNYAIDWNATTASGSDISSQSSGSIIFNPGDTLKSIPLSIINDNTAEKDEQVTIRLSKPSSNSYLEVQSSYTYTIIDNDYVTYSFATSQASGNEFVRNCSVNVTLSSPCNYNVTLTCEIDPQYTTASSSDYSFPKSSQQITFTPGQTTATLHFQVNSDFINEQDEYIVFLLKANTDNVRPGNIVSFKYTITESRIGFP